MKPVHLVLDSLPAHKIALVNAYVASTNGRLTFHFCPAMLQLTLMNWSGAI